MPEPVLIMNRPFWARLLLLFWILEVAMGLLFSLTGARWLGPAENGMAIIMLVMGLLLAGAGVVMAGLSWRIARLSGPAIELTAEGLRDRRFSPAVIPWDAVSWKVMFNGRAYSLQFHLAPEQREQMHIYWPQLALSVFNRLLRYPEFTVVTLGTGLSAHQIGKRMEAFRPPLS